MLKPDKKFYTPKEYFEMERIAEYRSEYYHGEIFVISGGTPNHNLITINFEINSNRNSY